MGSHSYRYLLDEGQEVLTVNFHTLEPRLVSFRFLTTFALVVFNQKIDLLNSFK